MRRWYCPTRWESRQLPLFDTGFPEETFSSGNLFYALKTHLSLSGQDTEKRKTIEIIFLVTLNIQTALPFEPLFDMLHGQITDALSVNLVIQAVLPGALSNADDLLRTKLDPRYLGADFIVRCKSFRCTALENIPLIKEVCPVYNGQCFSYVVVCDDDPDILVFEFGYDILDIFYCYRVDAGEWPVKQDEFLGLSPGARAISQPSSFPS